jgi:hypothetical protein
MVKKSYELQMNWSRLKKQLIWAVGTSMEEEAPYSDLVKLLASQAFYYVKTEVNKLLDYRSEFEEMAGRSWNKMDGILNGQMRFDDSLNEHPWEETFPAYTLGRDPNTLDVIHRD